MPSHKRFYLIMSPPKSKPSRPSRKKNPPPISDAELIVMKVVWSRAPVTANQVVTALGDKTDWKPRTIQTLLTRLVRKGVLAFEKQGREYLFRPLVDAGDFAHAASRSFLQRLFDGEIAPFVACFLEREKLSREEIDELRRILDDKP
jgi:BlaI family transcriptional regulator, penicillinase repressor